MRLTKRQLKRIIRRSLLEGNMGTKTMNARRHLDDLDMGSRLRRGDMSGNDCVEEIQREFPDIDHQEASQIVSDYIEDQY